MGVRPWERRRGGLFAFFLVLEVLALGSMLHDLQTALKCQVHVCNYTMKLCSGTP